MQHGRGFTFFSPPLFKNSHYLNLYMLVSLSYLLRLQVMNVYQTSFVAFLDSMDNLRTTDFPNVSDDCFYNTCSPVSLCISPWGHMVSWVSPLACCCSGWLFDFPTDVACQFSSLKYLFRRRRSQESQGLFTVEAGAEACRRDASVCWHQHSSVKNATRDINLPRQKDRWSTL